MPIVYRKLFTDETEEELLKMSRQEATLNLTDKQISFCENYSRTNNAILAAKKAGYAHKSSHGIGWKLRQIADVNRYIMWLKARAAKGAIISAAEIIDLYARIAFADVTDFVTIKNGRVKLIDGAEIDGQLVTEVKQGRDGIGIKLADRLAAAQKLERYFDVMPADWKQKIEERKIEILQQRLELDKLKSGLGIADTIDDGFIDALRGTAEEVWGEGDDDMS